MAWVMGVDGCPAGWIAVLLPIEADAAPRIRLLANTEALRTVPEQPAVVAVDMPIGLPDRVGPGGRGPERLLRARLGARQSSVFAVPARAAVMADGYAAACAAAQATSDPPRKISKQAFFLFPKIRDLDTVLRDDPVWALRVHEVHPEGAFMRLNGGRPLAEPKKVKSRVHSPGMDERRALLAAAGLPQALLQAVPPRGAATDDLLDACACAVTALAILSGEALRFAGEPDRDRFGLPIVIWA